MPIVDYREWYRQEQERRKRYGLGAVGAPSRVYEDPYKPPSNSQMLKQTGKDALNLGVKAGVGLAVGGPVGAIAAAGPDAIKMYERQFKGAKQAAEAGDYKGVVKNMGPLGLALGSLGGYAVIPGAMLATALLRKPQTQVEEKRWKALRDAGFDIPQWVTDGKDIKDKNAWYNKDLAPDFVGTAPEGGQWTNNKFAMSRDVADLRPEDIWGYADNTETFGNNWADSSEEARRQVMQMALDNKLVEEGKGTVDINWTPELLDQAQTILGDSVAVNPEKAGRKMWVPPTNGWRPPTA